MAISFGGLGNGVDFGPIVDALVQAKRLPIDGLTTRKLDAQKKQTELGLLGAKLVSFQGLASSLRTRVSFNKNQVNVASASAQTPLSASVSSAAAPGTYQVTVNQLASAHQIISKASTAVSSTDTDIVSGASGTFQFQVGSGAVQTINLNADSTLEDLRAAINDLGAGVSGSILNTGSEGTPQFRLVLSANETGVDHTITIVADDTTLNTVATGVDTFQSAQDSEVVLGTTDVGAGTTAITINRSTNTLSDVIDGLTLNLQAIDTTNPVSISVTQDNAAVKEAISEFVAGYNDIVSFVNERTFYNTETKERGIFVGESLARNILDRVRESVFSQISGLTTYTGVSRIGFETQATDGTIKLNEATLDSALSTNFSAVRDLFVKNVTTGTNGIAEVVVNAIDGLDDIATGSLTIRQKALTKQVNDFTNQISFKEEALARFEEQQRLKFANLDGLLARLQGQLNQLQNAFPSINR
ncbi:flagellar filament capping protein FliD [Candidatus Nitrospira allomarina]|uniref:Flagellar hook-associated protein 2 n=1 Tax=Candidatus Nitrospira allomarina TaxID=3020900 RepID=A0AA96G8I1_9BACT|nr:flagellar filament capping protein FliD [Candidatus Nitrospira allomarina]WNM56841.1 flagellar filament capping protein FliD [Candidatus Nitrospira allomarina]